MFTAIISAVFIIGASAFIGHLFAKQQGKIDRLTFERDAYHKYLTEANRQYVVGKDGPEIITPNQPNN